MAEKFLRSFEKAMYPQIKLHPTCSRSQESYSSSFFLIRIYPKVNEIRENVIETPLENTAKHLKYCNISRYENYNQFTAL